MNTESAIEAKNRAASYLVAKYIPDLRRMEPRNIGVIVLTPDSIAARFLAEKDETGEVDGRAAPSFIHSLAAYKQWIAFWRRAITRKRIEDRYGETLSYPGDRYLEVLRGSGKGGYCLADGGVLLDRVAATETPRLVRHLYRELVATDEAEERPTLESQLRLVLKETRLDKTAAFISDYEVTLPDGNSLLPLRFSYALKNGSLYRLYERVSLHAPQREKNVFSAAWKFKHVIGKKVVEKQQTAALVYTPEDQLDEKVSQYLSELSSVTRVINLADLDSATREFALLPQLVKHL
jgi:hypothetical protein